MRIAFLAVFAAVGVAAPAHASAVAVPVNTKYFFQCRDQAKVRNHQGAAPWSTTAPSASFTTGAGCGFFEQSALASNAPGNDLVDAVFEGTHTGPVTNITVRLHDLLLTQRESTLLGRVTVDVALEIDGRVVLDTAPGADGVETVPTRSSTGLTQAIEFSMVGVGVSDAQEHTYRLTIGTPYYDTFAAWVFGASEFAAGIEFNPVKNSPARVRVTGP